MKFKKLLPHQLLRRYIPTVIMHPTLFRTAEEIITIVEIGTMVVGDVVVAEIVTIVVTIIPLEAVYPIIILVKAVEILLSVTIAAAWIAIHEMHENCHTTIGNVVIAATSMSV